MTKIFVIIKHAFKTFSNLYYMIALSLISIVLELISMNIFSNISSNNLTLFSINIADIHTAFLIAIGLLIIRFTSMFIVESYQVYIVRMYQLFLSTKAFETIFKLPISVFEQHKIGYYVSMAGDDASKTAEILHLLLRFISSIILTVFYFYFILYLDGYLLLIIGLVLLITFQLILKTMKKNVEYSSIALDYGRMASSIFIDGINGLKVINSFNLISFVTNAYYKYMKTYQMVNFKQTTIGILNKVLPVVILFIFIFIYLSIEYNVHSASHTILMIFVIMRLLITIGDMLQIISKIAGDIKHINNIIEFIQKENIVVKSVVLENNIQVIKLDNIDFSYNQDYLFHKLYFKFERSKHYAIIGKTGSGKSTLLDLITGFKNPASGEILINNINLNLINSESLKNKILYVSQESIIFNDTIRNNICLDKNYTDEEIFKALEIVDLKNTVDVFPEKLNMLLYYKGTNLSGGQRQRLNIARAVIRNPDVLILDESVNALDIETRLKVVRNLKDYFKHKMIIFVTHDQDILKLVDEIIDLDKLKKVSESLQTNETF